MKCQNCESLKQRIAELEEEVADLRDRFLRSLAEHENVRRRVIHAVSVQWNSEQ